MYKKVKTAIKPLFGEDLETYKKVKAAIKKTLAQSDEKEETRKIDITLTALEWDELDELSGKLDYDVGSYIQELVSDALSQG